MVAVLPRSREVRFWEVSPGSVLINAFASGNGCSGRIVGNSEIAGLAGIDEITPVKSRSRQLDEKRALLIEVRATVQSGLF